MVKRFFLMLLTLIGMSIIIFVLLRLMPGNIVDIMFDSAGFVDPAEKAQIEKELGLDQPIPVQYGRWILGLVQWDLGFSYVSEMPAVDELAPRIPITAKLAALALFFSVLFGVPLGVISAVKQDTWLDYLLRVISLSGLSMPSFWLALLILMFFVAQFGTIPIYLDPPENLWSKGASENKVNYSHALKNAFLPVTTIIGIEAAFLIGGLIITETVFNIPGVAHFLVEAILMRDYPIVQNLVMLVALIVVTINFLVDLTYGALDPRIKYAD
jgi:peptide/nickel transport system permease protein